MTASAQDQSGRSIAQALLQEFEQELGTTRKFLERLPDDRLSWQPHEKSMTAGQLALHLAELSAGVLRLSMEDEGTVPDFRERRQANSQREVLDLLEQNASFVRQTLPGIDDQRMLSTFNIVKGGQIVMSFPRGAFLRMAMLNHWYHHRGQFSVYLRLMGASVPASYGPSADE